MSPSKRLNSPSEDYRDCFPCEPELAGARHPGTVPIHEYPEVLEELTDWKWEDSWLVLAGSFVPDPAYVPSTIPEPLQ